MKPTPIATPVKAFEAIAPATNLKPITNTIHTTCPTLIFTPTVMIFNDFHSILSFYYAWVYLLAKIRSYVVKVPLGPSVMSFAASVVGYNDSSL